jgi:hypothetical protein
MTMRDSNREFLNNVNRYPLWAAYIFDNRIRKLIHNPNRILGKYVLGLVFSLSA